MELNMWKPYNFIKKIKPQTIQEWSLNAFKSVMGNWGLENTSRPGQPLSVLFISILLEWVRVFSWLERQENTWGAEKCRPYTQGGPLRKTGNWRRTDLRFHLFLPGRVYTAEEASEMVSLIKWTRACPTSQTLEDIADPNFGTWSQTHEHVSESGMQRLPASRSFWSPGPQHWAAARPGDLRGPCAVRGPLALGMAWKVLKGFLVPQQMSGIGCHSGRAVPRDRGSLDGAGWGERPWPLPTLSPAIM